MVTTGLSILILGLAVFLASHLFVRSQASRAALIARTGEVAYRILFSAVSLIALALIVYGFARYRAEGWIDVWYPPRGMRHATVALMLPSLILAVAAFVPGRLKVWTKYPMLVAIKLWAFAHLLSNGDLGSILLFTTFLAWAVMARIGLKRNPASARLTPTAIPAGGWRNDGIAVATGVVVYLAVGYVFHPAVIGVPVFGV